MNSLYFLGGPSSELTASHPSSFITTGVLGSGVFALFFEPTLRLDFERNVLELLILVFDFDRMDLLLLLFRLFLLVTFGLNRSSSGSSTSVSLATIFLDDLPLAGFLLFSGGDFDFLAPLGFAGATALPLPFLVPLLIVDFASSFALGSGSLKVGSEP